MENKKTLSIRYSIITHANIVSKLKSLNCLARIKGPEADIQDLVTSAARNQSAIGNRPNFVLLKP